MANPQKDPEWEAKRKTILYGGSIMAVLYLCAAVFVTQSIAAETGYHPLLGQNLEIFGFHIYFPFQYMFWQDDPEISKAIPNILKSYKWYTVGAVLLGAFFMFIISKNAKVDISHGSAAFAKNKDITESDLGYYETKNGGVFEKVNGKKVPKISGVVVGINPYTKKLMLHNGPEHILLMAPTRSGKGINTIIPTGLVWKNSIFFFDPKGELWANTAGYRKEDLHQKVMKFEPLCTDGSANRWNPLAEINFRTNEEISDVKTIVDVMVKPDGEKKGGGDPFWDNSAINLMNGVIMHLMYKHYKEKRPLPSPTDIMSFLSSPDKGTKDLFADMMTYPHITPEEFLEEMHPVQVINDQGNPIFDRDGEPVYEELLDEHGKPQLAIETGHDGKPVMEQVYDKDWNPVEGEVHPKYIVKKDRKGKPVYEVKKDDFGKPLLIPAVNDDNKPIMENVVDAKGNPKQQILMIPVYQEMRDKDGNVIYDPERDEDGTIKRGEDGLPIYKAMLNGEGNPMTDEEGNVIPKPLYKPVYQHQYKMTKYINPLRQIYGNYYVSDLKSINEKLTQLVKDHLEKKVEISLGERDRAKIKTKVQEILELEYPMYISRDKERRFKIAAKTIDEIQAAIRTAIILGIPQIKTQDDIDDKKGGIDWVTRKDDDDKSMDDESEQSPFERLLVHPRVAESAATIYNGAEQTSASIMQTAQTALGVYGDPVVQRNMCVSDFCIRDLLDPKFEVSCYLVMQVKDIATVRPISRLFINTILNKLIRDMKFDVGGTAKKVKKQRLLLMLDEFPQLGNMKSVELALAICAGYGIKMCIVCQDVNQLNKEYTKDNSIASNCHVHIYFTPNLDPSGSTAKAISETLGKKTIKSVSHSDGGGLGKGSNSTSSQARELMTPDEVAKMSTENELVFVAGHKPILGDKLRYYQHEWFLKRLKKTPILSDPVTRIETYGELFKMHEADTLDKMETMKSVVEAKVSRLHRERVAQIQEERNVSREEAEAEYQREKALGFYGDLNDEKEDFYAPAKAGDVSEEVYSKDTDHSHETNPGGIGRPAEGTRTKDTKSLRLGSERRTGSAGGGINHFPASKETMRRRDMENAGQQSSTENNDNIVPQASPVLPTKPNVPTIHPNNFILEKEPLIDAPLNTMNKAIDNLSKEEDDKADNLKLNSPTELFNGAIDSNIEEKDD